MKKLLYLLVLPVSLCFMGCEALDDLDKYPVVDQVNTATYPINGDYFVTLDLFDATTNAWVEDYYSAGFTKITFSNTAANSKDAVWFDDLAFWPTKAIIKCDPATRSFTAGTYNSSFEELILKPGDDTLDFHASHPIDYKAVSLDKTYTNSVKDSVLVSGYKMTVKITGGSIELGTYLAPSKTKTDAITIELEWSDDPGTKYRYKGYRRTGFLEDEN